MIVAVDPVASRLAPSSLDDAPKNAASRRRKRAAAKIAITLAALLFFGVQAFQQAHVAALASQTRPLSSWDRAPAPPMLSDGEDIYALGRARRIAEGYAAEFKWRRDGRALAFVMRAADSAPGREQAALENAEPAPLHDRFTLAVYDLATKRLQTFPQFSFAANRRFNDDRFDFSWMGAELVVAAHKTVRTPSLKRDITFLYQLRPYARAPVAVRLLRKEAGFCTVYASPTAPCALVSGGSAIFPSDGDDEASVLGPRWLVIADGAVRSVALADRFAEKTGNGYTADVYGWGENGRQVFLGAIGDREELGGPSRNALLLIIAPSKPFENRTPGARAVSVISQQPAPPNWRSHLWKSGGRRRNDAFSLRQDKNLFADQAISSVALEGRYALQPSDFNWITSLPLGHAVGTAALWAKMAPDADRVVYEDGENVYVRPLIRIKNKTRALQSLERQRDAALAQAIVSARRNSWEANNGFVFTRENYFAMLTPLLKPFGKYGYDLFRFTFVDGPSEGFDGPLFGYIAGRYGRTLITQGGGVYYKPAFGPFPPSPPDGDAPASASAASSKP